MIHQAHAKERGPQRTAVTVSIHTTNESAVRYLESDREYSFHICAMIVGRLARSSKWRAKYPVLV